MKNANEFFERYHSDEDFRREVHRKIKPLKEAGAENLFTAVVKVAESLGYAVTEDEVKASRKAKSIELSDELMSSVSGGLMICAPGGSLC